ncbi:hypothetical protein FACS1894139_15030 [Planctomycetales bacterium]|nr:hypothetical protein FACS1894107_07460 [Planctomycetales bacterium]GHS99801.1 hypothetical protein FACS1894108_10510 [Planctomycetales bacterium]GHT07213.1 hypothetical protein FACS1894139_15030 [Planctomycetales bacterium]
MLVLSRRRDETIMIGDEIEITVVDIKGDAVRIGINAPRAVSVHRKEVYDSIKAENENLKAQAAPTADTLGNLAKMLGPYAGQLTKLSRLQPSQLSQTLPLSNKNKKSGQ